MFAQEVKQVPKEILSLQAQNKDFKKFSLFTVKEDYNNSNYEKEVEGATLVTLNQTVLNSIVAEKPEYLQIAIPYNNKEVEVVLYKVQIHTNDFQIDTDKARNVKIEAGVHYRGIINGNINSIASFNFFKGEMNGIVSSNELDNLNIGKLKDAVNRNDYIIFSDSKLKKPLSFECGVTESASPEVEAVERTVNNVASTRCVTVYFELDYSAYQNSGSDLTTTSNWFSSIFNNVQTLYTNEGITTALKSLFIWTSLDPYEAGTSSTEYLNAFIATRTAFNGDLAHLVSLNAGGFGGLAYLNGLCGSNKYGYSDIYSTFSTVPTYSWTVQVITHELGHQMGSQHTHACAWNGNNTAIDGCGPLRGYVEGTCAQAIVPYAAKGTIMSYCHLVSGVGILFTNGFGPQPAARILGKVEAATCLSTDCIDTCTNGVEGFSVAVTETTANLSWTDSNVASTSWEVGMAVFPFTVPTWTLVSTTSYTYNNLTSGTYYKFYVRPICTGGRTISHPTSQLVATGISNVCAAVFRDSGGTNFNYSNNEDWTRTFTPPTGSAVKVTFATLGLEANFDYLYVYDGIDINAPLLGTLTGNRTNVSFLATNSAGALTFRFKSDIGTVATGWNATLSCEALGINEFSKLGFDYYPNPVKEELILNSKSEVERVQIYSIDGRLVFEQKNAFNETKINTSSFAKGTYIVKVSFKEGSSGAFKIVKQ